MSTETARQPAGVPVGGQFATNPKTEAALALPNYTKTTLGFAGVAVLDGIGVEPLPAWPVTLPDPSEPSYSWGDDGDLEVSICFGDDEVDIWGNHDTWSSNFEGVPEEFEHLSDAEKDGAADYARQVHSNLLHLTGQFEYAAHAAPHVRATLIGLATGQGAPQHVEDAGAPGYMEPTVRRATRAERNLKAWFSTSEVKEENIQDALTDLLHLANAKGVSPAEFGGIFNRAQGTYRDELEHP